MNFSRFLALSVLSLSLAACGGSSWWNPFGGDDEGEALESTGPDLTNCPPVAIVSGTGNVTIFDGTGTLQDDVAYVGTISNLKYDCTQYDGAVGMNVTFDISVRRGPGGGASVNLPYFVSVVQGTRQVIGKQVFQSTHSFAGSDTSTESVGASNTVSLLSDGTPGDAEILVGFQLTREQYEYNFLK